MALEQLSRGESNQDADAEAGGYQPEELKTRESVNIRSSVVSIIPVVLEIILIRWQIFCVCSEEAVSSSTVKSPAERNLPEKGLGVPVLVTTTSRLPNRIFGEALD